jgi:hypothetical protein
LEFLLLVAGSEPGFLTVPTGKTQVLLMVDPGAAKSTRRTNRLCLAAESWKYPVRRLLFGAGSAWQRRSRSLFQAAATMELTGVHLDAQTRKAIAFPEPIRAAIKTRFPAIARRDAQSDHGGQVAAS